MPESEFERLRTFGVEAERLSECEFFLRRRCDSIAAEVRGIIGGGGMELGFPCSNDVCNGSNGCCSMAGSWMSCPSNAMANCFILFVPSSPLKLVEGSRDRYRSFTLKIFPAAI